MSVLEARPGASAIAADAATHEHLVHFYADDGELCGQVARYLADGISAGEPAIAIATAPHRAQIAAALAARGHGDAEARGQLVMHDAETMLARFMVGDQADRERFAASVGDELARLHETAPDRRIRAYGEMVDVLWRAGNRSGAIVLESLWNQLAEQRSFALLCAYVIDHYYRAADVIAFAAVCDAHTGVLHGEDVGERAQVLEREIAHRGEVEAALRDALAREQAAREDAERSLRFNELFAGMLGHDLRNPLGTIAMGASHLVRTHESERVTRTATRIVASAERMTRMVDQLLDLTRLRTAGGFMLAPTRFDLAELWRGIGDELAAGARVAVYARGDTAGEWDRDRLAQVAATIVHNAVVHRAAGAPIEIVVDGSDPAAVAVRIHNDGEVPSELVPVLFEPFRGTVRRGAHTRGLGVGLYLAQQIVAAHGGRIEAATSEGGGTTIHIELPRRTVRSEPL
ncbi:MAG: MEDS domain-containing protein [Acidobacteriota bacterium]